jgi:hypothetical protein
MRVVVLLKNGKLEAVECPDRDIFLLARLRDAGICGAFNDRPAAKAFIAQLHAQQRTIAGWQAAANASR